MSERGKRVVRVLLDRERDADVVERIERQGSITGYLRTLVRRDIHDERIHDERLDYAAMKAAELQDENAKLRELIRDMWRKNLWRMDNPCSWCVMDCAGDDCDFEQRLRELGVVE